MRRPVEIFEDLVIQSGEPEKLKYFIATKARMKNIFVHSWQKKI